MAPTGIEADYVIIGAGATAMSFADVILAESDRTIALVDRHARPGGHWNEAYAFVRLHQPAAYYGVNSRQLGSSRRDTAGPNAGLYELATGTQVLTYFDDVMHEQFLPTGRVTYLPMSEYREDGTVVSAITGGRTTITARRRVVDARYLGSVVPSAHTPTFAVAQDVGFIPINGLADVAHAPSGYVVIGAGKTGVDACLWLLELGVDPDRICWIRPRDAWFLNRARVQPDINLLAAYADMLEAAASADSVDDLVRALESAGVLLRIDAGHWPTMYRVATITAAEAGALHRIGNVVRLGYVTSIEPGIVHLQHGDVHTGPDWLHVDCTAEGLRNRPAIPIFQDGRITLQYAVIDGHPTYSAALIAHIELALADDASRNHACPPVPITSELRDIAEHLLADLEAQETWAGIPGLNHWMEQARLNPEHWALRAVDPSDKVVLGALERIAGHADDAKRNLGRILAPTAS